MDRDKIILHYLKWILINHKHTWVTWKEINRIINGLMETIEKKDIKISPTEIRQKYFKTLQKDTSFTLENGFPITKNSVGVKLTDDREEVEKYINKETNRFIKGLANLNPAKQYYKNTMERKGLFYNQEEDNG